MEPSHAAVTETCRLQVLAVRCGKIATKLLDFSEIVSAAPLVEEFAAWPTYSADSMP